MASAQPCILIFDKDSAFEDKSRATVAPVRYRWANCMPEAGKLLLQAAEQTDSPLTATMRFIRCTLVWVLSLACSNLGSRLAPGPRPYDACRGSALAFNSQGQFPA